MFLLNRRRIRNKENKKVKRMYNTNLRFKKNKRLKQMFNS